jgi:glutamate-1-semialdehyde 2,1-aminomutase
VKGTFSAELAGLAAAHATLDVIEHDQICTRLATVGATLIDRVNLALKEAGVNDLVQVVPYRWDAMPHLHAPTDDPLAKACRRTIVTDAQHSGVLLLEQHNSFVCAAHTDADVERTAEVVHQAADAWHSTTSVLPA